MWYIRYIIPYTSGTLTTTPPSQGNCLGCSPFTSHPGTSPLDVGAGQSAPFQCCPEGSLLVDVLLLPSSLPSLDLWWPCFPCQAELCIDGVCTHLEKVESVQHGSLAFPSFSTPVGPPLLSEEDQEKRGNWREQQWLTLALQWFLLVGCSGYDWASISKVCLPRQGKKLGIWEAVPL